jgi:hypothetical protein
MYHGLVERSMQARFLVVMALAAALLIAAPASCADERANGVDNCDPPTTHVQPSQPKLLKATVTEQEVEGPKRPPKPTADQIRAQASMLERYKHPNMVPAPGSSGAHQQQKHVTPAGSTQPNKRQPQGATAAEIRAQAAWLERFKHPTSAAGSPVSSSPSSASGSPNVPHATTGATTSGSPAAASKQLPRWGDRSCLCHDGYRLFMQHRYLEAAQMYRKAGDNMLSAWGHENNDIANARRGEAVAYAAAGQWPKAEALYKDAVRIYINSSAGHPSSQLQGTILDLADTLKNERKLTAAGNLSSRAAQIENLSHINPAQAAKQFASLTD